MSYAGKIQWKPFGNNEQNELRRKLPVFIACLFISTFVWGLIKLSRTYEQTVEVKLQYINQPEEAVVSFQNENIVSTRIRAEGFHLLLWKWHIYKSRLRIDMGKLPLQKPLSDTVEVIVMPALQVIKTMAVESRLPGAVTRVFPENITFKVARRNKKKVAVVPELEIDFAHQYRLYSHAVCIPDSVTITGAYDDLKNINAVTTNTIKFKRLNHDVEKVVSIHNSWKNKGISISHYQIKVLLDVESYTEASISLPIKVSVTGTELGIKTFPESVNLFYQVALKDYKSISESDFEMLVKYDHNSDQLLNSLTVEVVSFPDNVYISRIVPDKVEYVLIK